ncbi:MAG: UDP-2,4-diacetamido-2,4,6-trideoxy-beta-L-altropyranose hydrolase [Succinivibrionaceae bacterium]|nr:UDP-2,4-diacetamido-2,4,6-trideoxy-beta-L-altropyranose hydrolase [Succinivibrionaceae bacterium]
MKIAIRVDANEIVATGHLVRDIAIANQLRKHNAEVLFILAEAKQLDRLEQNKFPYRILHSDWRKLDEELPLLKKLIAEEQVDLIMVDSYSASNLYLADLNGILPVIYIDDLSKEIYDIAMVIHYIPNIDETEYKLRYRNASPVTMVFTGLEFCPLRDEFSNLLYRDIQARPMNILLTTGGTDPLNLEFKILNKILSSSELGNFTVDVIIGDLSTHFKELDELRRKNPARVRLHQNVVHMSDFMSNSRIAVSACGTTLYELCTCGLPSVAFAIADNQLKVGEYMDRMQLINYCGDARKCKIEDLVIEQVEKLAGNEELLTRISSSIVDAVDGDGTERIAEKIIALSDR